MTRPSYTPNRLILDPGPEADPRTALDDRALVEASRNAFPVVAASPKRRDSLGLLAGGTFALLLGGLTFWSMSGHRAAPPPAPAATAVEPAAESPSPARLLPAPPPGGLILPHVPPAPLALQPLPPTAGPAPAPVVVYDTGTAAPIAAAADGGGAPASAPAQPGRPGIAGGDGNDQFAARIGDGEVPVASAQRLSDPASTVTQGTLIPAVLETAIDTDLPGYVRALVSQDVRSFDGAHVLIPRSSRLIGQYKSGLAAGQTRAYVIWSRLIRPDGASVALGSPAVDFSGNSGLAGKVDGHFMKRFGSAVLLSVVGGLGAIGSGGTSVVLSSGGQSAAGVAAQRDTAIPPTIRVPQGQPIRIFTARDLDFSGVAPVATVR